VIVFGLGGNVGSDEEILGRFGAVALALEAWAKVSRSRVYRTAPIGPAQPAFLNAAIGVRPDVEPTPEELAAFVLETERLLGRDRAREARWGPRTIDVDVLLWGDRQLRDPIEVPHPRLAERRFALRPLADLVGEVLVVPGTGRTIGELLAATADQAVEETALEIR
jgi:2-amino-4-hydroxy-6-hydroxymethyldihydropteridine diphosphokinase